MKLYDLAIIGSGPGGYVASLYASRLNLKTCVIEKGLIGGTCLNRGCIPTKSLIDSASIITTFKTAPLRGIETANHVVNYSKMSQHKDETVARLRSGVETLLRANKVDIIKGEGSIQQGNVVKVDGYGDIKAKYIIIATGSRWAPLKGINIDELDIFSSDGILSLKELPKSILIAGGGVIGCEFASLFNLLGVKVTIAEFADRLIASQSRECSKKLEASYKRMGIDVILSSDVEKISKTDILEIFLSGGGRIYAEKVLISVGRVPYTENLNLEAAGIITEQGSVVVDKFLRTSVNNVFAIGDCVKGPLLAHRASYDAMVACDNISGQERVVDYSNIPNLIWTHPEIASVGLNEEEARAQHPDLLIVKFPYSASGKAFLKGLKEGYVKVMGSPEGIIAGVEIMGEGACEMIAEAVLARSRGIKIGEWSRVIHGHPTLSEMMQEACHIFCRRPIHSM